MFDFAWSEIALIGVLALVLIGPKDLPIAMKAISQMIKKARRMAGEFQTHVDEMVREADLHEVRDTFHELRRMDIKGQILKAVDSDGAIRQTLNEPGAEFAPPPPPVPVADSVTEAAAAAGTPATASEAAPEPPPPEAPAFVPPRFAPARASAAPAFIPPAAASARHSVHA